MNTNTEYKYRNMNTREKLTKEFPIEKAKMIVSWSYMNIGMIFGDLEQ